MTEKTLVVIDTDCGVDDALAIVLALSQPTCDVKAITCCHGNTSLDHVWRNVFRVLKICGRTDIPVYIGCEVSSLGMAVTDRNFHGSDGFGEIGHTIPVNEFQAEPEHASNALVQLANKYEGQLTLVALGPLTNLAIAQRLDKKFSSKLKDLYIMGGNTNGEGNIQTCVEFNFFCDPEAAFVVLNEFKCPKICIPWEACHYSRLPWDWYYNIIKTNTKIGCFFRDLTKFPVKLMHDRSRTGYHCCDFAAMAVLFNPKVVLEKQRFFAQVELTGKLTRGQMIIERRTNVNSVTNLDIVLKLDPKELAKEFEKLLSSNFE